MPHTQFDLWGPRRELLLAWSATRGRNLICLPVNWNLGCIGALTGSLTEVDFKNAGDNLKLIMDGYRCSLLSPLMEEIPGGPHPSVLLRMIEDEHFATLFFVEESLREQNFTGAVDAIRELLAYIERFAGPLILQALAALAVAHDAIAQPSPDKPPFSATQRDLNRYLFAMEYLSRDPPFRWATIATLWSRHSGERTTEASMKQSAYRVRQRSPHQTGNSARSGS